MMGVPIYIFISWVLVVGFKVFVVGCLKGWPLGGRSQPVLDIAVSRGLHSTLIVGQSWTHQQSWWCACENVLKKGQKYWVSRGGEEKRSSVNTKVIKGGGRGALDTGAEIPLQPIGSSMAEQVFTLHPVQRTYARAEEKYEEEGAATVNYWL